MHTDVEISIIKINLLKKSTKINENEKLSITSVTHGETCTFGTTEITLSRLSCTENVFSHDFPIAKDSMVGWDMFKKYNGLLCAKNDVIILYDIEIPLLEPKSFEISADKTNTFTHMFMNRAKT